MSHSVFYVDLGIELNLTLPDLGQPGLPGLWEQLKAEKCQPGRLQCPQCRDNDPDCPEWMYLQERAGGCRVAVHHNRRVRDHGPAESDTHKALEDRIALATISGGFGAKIESRAEYGRRCADVLGVGGEAVWDVGAVGEAAELCGHVWPAEVDADSCCELCGLVYLEYAHWS